MRMKLLAALAVLALTGGIVAVIATPEGAKAKATVYKSPECHCCGNYVGYLRKHGFDVRIEEIADMTPLKRRFGIPPDLESCHSMAIGGYIVEGHVPIAAIDRLLAEKPDIRGIALPGMPEGSPGMPGPKSGPFVIHTISGAGSTVFMVQ
jgi:hypothetical protein